MMNDIEKTIAELDQAGEMVKILTPLLWGYFHSLIEQGFTREESLALTLGLQGRFFQPQI